MQGTLDWSDVTILIPQGNHTLTWQLNAVTGSYFFPVSMNPATLPGVQGWVKNLEILTPRENYDKWSSNHGIDASKKAPEQDADGDGISNLIEYGFKSAPTNANSKPQNIILMAQTPRIFTLGRPQISQPSPKYLYLGIPYISPSISAKLESSTDLISWSEWPTKLSTSRSEYRSTSWLGSPISDETHQSIELEISENRPKRYFRVNFSLPDN